MKKHIYEANQINLDYEEQKQKKKFKSHTFYSEYRKFRNQTTRNSAIGNNIILNI